MNSVIYSNNDISKQLLEIFLNILSLFVFVYLSRNLLSNPIGWLLLTFILSFTFFYCIFGYLFSQKQNNESDIIIDKSDMKNESETIIRKDTDIDIVKYKHLLKKFKSLRREFKETKNDIRSIKDLLLFKQNTDSCDKETGVCNSELDSIIDSDVEVYQKFVDNIRDTPYADEEILDNIANDIIINDVIEEDTENNYELIR